MDAAQPAQCVEGLVGDIPEEPSGRVHGDHVKQCEAFRAAHAVDDGEQRLALLANPNALCGLYRLHETETADELKLQLAVVVVVQGAWFRVALGARSPPRALPASLVHADILPCSATPGRAGFRTRSDMRGPRGTPSGRP
jgi:hypothetical protein